MDKLKDLFYNPKEGLINLKKLKQKAKEKDIDVNNQEIEEFYNKQPVNQLMKKTTKPKEFNSIIAYAPNQIYQMDIIVYDRYTIDKYKYILVVIDVYSRFVQARAMTNRRIETIFENFENIIKVMGLCETMECDNEFNTKKFNKYFETNDIEVVYSDTEDTRKNAIVERVNGTIALLLQKVRITTKNYKWYKYLDDVIENYNNTIHGTIKNKPIEIFNGKKFNEQHFTFVDNPFKINDKVRIKRKKKIFSKGDEIKFSKEIYIVEDVKKNKVKLNNFTKLYKPDELQKVYNVDENETIVPKTETKNNKIKNYLKREGIEKSNIIEEKRKR